WAFLLGRDYTLEARPRNWRRGWSAPWRPCNQRRQFGAAFATILREQSDGLIVIPDPLVSTHRDGSSRLGRRSTIVGVPPSAVANFAKSLIVVARRGFSDAARRSIVSRSERSFFARAPLGCDVSRGRERDVRDESASICLGGAGFREEFNHEPAARYTPSLR